MEELRIVDKSLLDDIANSLRTVNKTDDKYTLDGMASEIRAIPANVIDNICPQVTFTGNIVSKDFIGDYPLTVQTETDATKITRCGKNLIDADALLSTHLTKDENGIYHMAGTKGGGSATIGLPMPIPANTPVRIKFYDFEGYNANSTALLSTTKYFVDGTSESGSWVGFGGNFTNEVTLQTSKPFYAIKFYTYNPSEDYYCKFSAVQAEIGTVATKYESYQAPEEFAPGETIPALEGRTTICADVGEITVIGRQSEYDRFWDDFQANGTRTDYYCLFYGYGWTAETFKPKYDIRGTRMQSAFAYTAGLAGSLIDMLNECGVVLDTSQTTNIGNMFSQAVAITESPHIDLSSLTVTAGALFQGCRLLRRIEKVTYTENVNCYHNATYGSCSALVDIEIAGVVAGDMNFEWSPLLSKASIESIVTHLSKTSEGKTLKLSATAVKSAFGTTDPSTCEEWLTLINDYQNWNFVLA